MNNIPSQPSNIPTPEGESPAQVMDWVNKARAGDESAFGELVKMYNSRVHAVIYRLVRNEDDTRDVSQQAWVKAWRRLDSYEQDSQFFTWLYRIAVNASLDFLRQRGRKREVSVEDRPGAEEDRETEWPQATEDTPDRQLARDEVRRAFDEALQCLSAEHRTALILREVEGRSYREIAEATGSRIGTVMSRIFYARKLIQEKMKEVR